VVQLHALLLPHTLEGGGGTHPADARAGAEFDTLINDAEDGVRALADALHSGCAQVRSLKMKRKKEETCLSTPSIPAPQQAQC
jgi:hypothetical protein